MNKRSNFSLNKVTLPGYTARKLHKFLSESSYSEESGAGILKSSRNEDVVSGLLLKRSPTFIDEYNPRTGDLEQREIFVFNEVSFHIDFKHNLLYSIGTATNLVQVRTFLKNRLDGIEFTAAAISPYEVFNTLTKAGLDFAVKEVCVDKFNYQNKAVGRFSAKIFDSEIVPELVENYKMDVSRIVLDVQQEDEPFLLFVQNNNSIGISCEPDDVFENFETIKSILF